MKQERTLFRGKRLGGGQWVQGGIAPAYHCAGDPGAPEDEARGYSIIQDGRAYAVAQDSIGQCTGMNDCRGALLFEGDLVRSDSPGGVHLGRIRFGLHAANQTQERVSLGFWIEWADDEFLRSELGFWRGEIQRVQPWADDPSLWDQWCEQGARAARIREDM